MRNAPEADLDSAAAAAAARYAAANPASAAQVAAASRWLPGGNTRVALHYDPFRW